MTTVYLHIGMPKTGSTSLQKFLFANRIQLLEEGYLYPITGTKEIGQIWDRYSHNSLSKQLETKHDVWEQLQQEIEISKAQNIVISSEFFTYPKRFFDNTNSIKKIRTYLQNYSVKIIIYLRDQVDFLQSLYAQMIKSNLQDSSIKIMIEKEKFRCYYYSMLELWSFVFGLENILVRVFEKEQLKNANLYDDFLSAIHFPLLHDDFRIQPCYTNTSPSIKVIKIMRILNQYSHFLTERISFDQLDNLKIKKWINRQYSKKHTHFLEYLSHQNELTSIINRLPDFVISDSLLTSEEKYSLKQEFLEENSRVACRYLNRPDGKLFKAR